MFKSAVLRSALLLLIFISSGSNKLFASDPLSALTISNGTLSPSFNSTTYAYTVSVPNSTSSITVTPTLTNAAVGHSIGVKVNSGSYATVSSGATSAALSLNVGTNTIIVKTSTLTVTDFTYTITITRAPSSDATLTGLSISSGTLSPSFASITTSYADSVPGIASSVAITPTVNEADATVTVNGKAVTSGSASSLIALNMGSNTITTVVTAQDGTTQKQYTINVTRLPYLPYLPSAFSYATPNAFTMGSAITPLSPTAVAAGTITTPDSGSALSAPVGVALDAAGNVYVVTESGTVNKIALNGTITTLGSGFNGPMGVAVDALGNVYVADWGNNAVKKIAPNGTITTLGSGFNGPMGVAVDALGNVYVGDANNNAVKKIAPDGAITKLGSGWFGPAGVAVDAAGNVYVADPNSSLVEKIAPDGVTIDTLGSGFRSPLGVAVDAAGNVYVADAGNNAVKKIAPDGVTVSTLVSGVSNSEGVAVDAAGNVYVVAPGNNAVKQIAGAGGSVSSYSISPALPAGFSFNTSTGSISGTPTVVSAATNYVVTASNLGGSVHTNISISVVARAPSASSYTIPNVFIMNSAITPLSPAAVAAGTITTLGSGFRSPDGVAVDAAGNVYVADAGNNAVKKIAPDGTITTLGSGFTQPGGVAVDAAGNVYVADAGNMAVKKIAPDGTITTLGSGFLNPTYVALDAAGNIYVADTYNSAVKKIASNGVTVTTLGSGFSIPHGVAVDAVGNVYVADAANHAVKKIATDGVTVSTLATGFSDLGGVAVDAAGNVYVTDWGNNAVNKIAPNGTIDTLGSGFNQPAAVAVDAAGNVYVVGGIAVQKIAGAGGPVSSYSISPALPAGLSIDTITGIISGTPTVASTAHYLVTASNFVGSAYTNILISVIAPAPPPAFSYTTPNVFGMGSAITPLSPTAVAAGTVTTLGSGFSQPYSVAVDAAGNVYVADAGNSAVQKIAPNGTITTLRSGFNTPYGVAVDAAGNVYVADANNNAVKKIAPDGTVTTLGSGFNHPYGVAVDAAGNVYVADTYNGAVKKIASDGTITALGSGFVYPIGVAVDAAGNVYVGNYGESTVEKIASDGVTVTTLGSGFSQPYSVAVDAAGNVYVADAANNAVKKIATDGVTVTALSSGFRSPYGVAVDAVGNVYVADWGNNAVKKIAGAGGVVSSYSISPALPAGLNFNTITGSISGTPTVASDATNYVVTASNLGGSAYTNISISVIAPPSAFSYTTPNVFGMGSAITPLSPTAVGAGGAVSSYSISPALPAGLSIDASTGIISGTPTAVSAATNYVVTASNLGGSAYTNIKISVIVLAPSAFSYTTPNVFGMGSAITPLSATAVAAGTVTTLGSGFSLPEGVAVDAAYNVYVADNAHNAVKKIALNGTITTLGSGFSSPTGVAVDAAGNVYVADEDNNAVKKIAPDGTITTLGSGFNHPYGVAVDALRNVYVADANHSAVKKITPVGAITTLGSGFSYPYGVAVDALGNVYVADNGHNAVKKIAPDGITITTLGSGFSQPYSVAVDAAGNVYVADAANNAVKKIATDGTITTLGSGFKLPMGVAVDAVGNVYVADWGNNAVKKIAGAGGAVSSYSISPALPAGLSFNTSSGIISGTPTVASAATNYVVTASNLGGSATYTVNITIISGCTPTTATINQTACGSYAWHGTTYTTSGSYTFDSLNAKGCDSLTTLHLTITSAISPSVSIAANPAGSISAGTSVTFTATPANGGSSPAYQWQKGGTNISGATSATYTYTPANGDVITCVLTANNPCQTTASATSASITLTVTVTSQTYTYNFSSNKAFRDLGAVLTNVNTSQFNSSQVYSYDNSTWAAYSGVMTPGKGYRVLVDGTATPTITTTGSAVLSGNQSPTLTGGQDEFSFIANPYQVPVDFTALTTNGIYNGYWYLNPQIFYNGYLEYDYYGTNIGSSNIYSGNAASQYVQPGQGFFVCSNTSGTPSLTFTEASKAVSHTANVFGVIAPLNRIATGLFKNGSNVDGAVAVFNSQFSNNIAEEDGFKMSNAGENLTFTVAGKDLCANGWNLPNATDELPLHLYNLTANTVYTIKLDASQFNGNGLSAYLQDNVLNTKTLLTGVNNEVSFTTGSNATTDANRYSIVFGAGALPVKSITLSATELTNKEASINWSVAGETNVRSYTIERSLDGNNFTELATVNAGASSYSYIDATAEANNYYRIKATDNSGAVSYSNVVNCKLSIVNSLLSIAPNPVTGNTFKLALGAVGKYTVSLVDALGKTVYTTTVNHSTIATLESVALTSKLAAGSYILKATDETGKVSTTQVIIK